MVPQSVIAILIIVTIAIMCGVVICMMNKSASPLDAVKSPMILPPVNKQGRVVPQMLNVLNCVTERVQEPGTFEHVIYFSLQEDASYFRFFINNQMIGQGSFEDLDIRYAPPDRRVVFVTTDVPQFPMKVRVEALASNVIIGMGELDMKRMCYNK